MSASNVTSSSRKAPPAGPHGNAAFSSSTAERFKLSGPSLVLDPRIHAYRRDIADVALAGQLFAPHYARPVVKVCGDACVLRETPTEGSDAVVDLRAGDEFAVLDVTGVWAWGYRRSDHLVGYVLAAALREAGTPG